MEKRYLGNHVYVEIDEADVLLTVRNSSTLASDVPDEAIYLDPQVVDAFLQFLTDMQAEETRHVTA